MGRHAHPPAGVSALRKAHDNVGEADRALIGRIVQELLGQKDPKTTMIYTHVLDRGVRGVKSPTDTL
jgi:integrase